MSHRKEIRVPTLPAVATFFSTPKHSTQFPFLSFFFIRSFRPFFHISLRFRLSKKSFVRFISREFVAPRRSKEAHKKLALLAKLARSTCSKSTFASKIPLYIFEYLGPYLWALRLLVSLTRSRSLSF